MESFKGDPMSGMGNDFNRLVLPPQVLDLLRYLMIGEGEDQFAIPRKYTTPRSRIDEFKRTHELPSGTHNPANTHPPTIQVPDVTPGSITPQLTPMKLDPQKILEILSQLGGSS